MNIPPPKFNLDSISPPPQKSSQGLFSPKQSQKKAVVLHPAVSFANAPMKTGPVQSGMLVNLTNTPSGYPCFEDAMNATNFPFLESARQHRPINYGVLKLKNVSEPLLLVMGVTVTNLCQRSHSLLSDLR